MLTQPDSWLRGQDRNAARGAVRERIRTAPSPARSVDERLVVARWLSHGAVMLLVLLVPMVGGLLGANAAPGRVFGLPSSARAADAPSTTATSRGFIVKPAGLGQTAQSHRDVITYTVQDGDVLGAIADKYGLRIDTLKQTNSLADVDTLALNQQLLIPPTNGVLLKVAA
ncbi:MAG TPA: LysM peptidoglycan-binding domain-containing protein, partial [Candidatus Dormibacteraeota bacterium]|nr:LysM peptidoglycan-binding domain-containing protein [Candidatus Dormibacteraeota bacterium]